MLVFQRTDVLGISRNADDAFIISRNPDVALPILADITDVAVAEVVFTFFHGQEVACIVGVHDTHTIAASYPHGFILRFENCIDEIVLNVFGITAIQLEGISLLRLDYDTVVIDGKPDFTIASLGNAGNTRGKRIVVQAAKTWNLPIIIGGTGVSVVKCYSVWVESQPEPYAIGGEYGIHVVDGRGILQVAQLPLLEERWGGW